jgi:hypothetical protein
MARALIAAKLNRLAGNPVDCIVEVDERETRLNFIINTANWWLQEDGLGDWDCGGSLGMCSASDDCWQDWEWVYEALDAYNNGELCAPSRDEVEEGLPVL